MNATAEKQKTAGLAGIVAGQTAISTVGQEDLGLTYRGYAIEDLAREATFEEVAYLLIHGVLPTRPKLEEYQRRDDGSRDLPEALREMLRRLPAAAHPMDVLRTGCSALGCLEPETQIVGRKADRRPVAGGAAFDAVGLASRQPLRQADCISEVRSRLLPGTSSNCCTASRPSERDRQALNVSLILYAEHEFNASTFACAHRRFDAIGLLFGGDRGRSARCAAPCTAAPTRRRWT